MSLSRTFLFLVLGIVLFIVYSDASIDVNPVSKQYPAEPHHSLHVPLDHSQVHWNFGGSTVITKKFIRLTPAAQAKQGWIWNEYPLDNDDFEVEIKFEMYSAPYYGGDGMALWFIQNHDDSNHYSDPEAISGPIFGMSRDFKGVGVVFDTYDNDNKHNNPAVYVLQNDEGNLNYSNDRDYEPDMLKTVPVHLGIDSNAYKCVGNFRNVGKPTKALVKYLNKVMYVYLDIMDGQGWRFCLAVEINRQGKNPSLKNTHLAFTAATGQVSDNMDLLEISTRYLKSSDIAQDLDQLKASVSGAYSSTLFSLVYTITAFISFGLFAYTIKEMQEYLHMVSNHIDAVAVAHKMNRHIFLQYLILLAFSGLTLLSLQYFVFFVSLPLVIIKYILYSRNALNLSPTMISRIGASGSGLLGLSPEARFYISIGFHGFTSCVYIWNYLF